MLRTNLFSNTIIFFLVLFLSVNLRAQENDTTAVQKPAATVELTDSMFQIIDNMHEKAASIKTMIRGGYKLDAIQKNLPPVNDLIASLELVIKNGSQYLDIKSLQTFGLLLEESKSELNKWRKQLLNYNQQIISTERDIAGMQEIPRLSLDSSNQFFVDLYKKELSTLETTWVELKKSNDNHQQEINELQLLVSKNYYQATDLERLLKQQTTNYSIRAFGKEANYFWERSVDARENKQESAFSAISLQISQQILASYFQQHIQSHLFFAFLIFVLFIIWVRKNYRNVSASENGSSILKSLEDPHTVSPMPLLSAFLVMFSLWPFLDLNAPEAYMIIIQFLLFITTSIFIFKHGSKKERFIWTGIIVVYFLSGVIGTSFHLGFWLRLGLIFINLYLIYSARTFLKLRGGDVRIQGITRTLLNITIIVNITAIVLNLAGRVTLSETFTNAALIGFVQIIGLSIFKDILVTSIQLHNVIRSNKEQQRSFVDMQTMSNKLFKLLSFLTLILCFAVFAINMNFYNAVRSGLEVLLFNPRTIGNTTFTFGNILLFFLVIYISSLAQRYVGYLFGEDNNHSIPQGKKGSQLVIWKLVIIVIGFTLAIIVSGLPLDKVTIVLSALGVGIGLGLQNVVNNFVSGLILIFERPLQIGDYVEVGGLKGWVKDIGIRATKMVNNDGAEMIVPNGSILAGNLTNWTLSNSTVRVEMQVKISPLTKLTLAKEIINEEIKNYEHAVNTKASEILQTTLNARTTELKVWFWVDHINRQEIAKSTILNQLFLRFEENGIEMT